mgnify:CR=1 FL=1
MLQRRGAVVGVHYVARLPVHFRDPPGEFFGVGDGGGEEDEADLVGEEHDALLPHHAALLVPHVVDLVEDLGKVLQGVQVVLQLLQVCYSVNG